MVLYLNCNYQYEGSLRVVPVGGRREASIAEAAIDTDG